MTKKRIAMGSEITNNLLKEDIKFLTLGNLKVYMYLLKKKCAPSGLYFDISIDIDYHIKQLFVCLFISLKLKDSLFLKFCFTMIIF